MDQPPHGITRCRELIAVAVAQIDCDPVVRDRLVHPALEIAVAYVEKIVALKCAARRYTVAHENAENLTANFLVGGDLIAYFGCFIPFVERRDNALLAICDVFSAA